MMRTTARPSSPCLLLPLHRYGLSPNDEMTWPCGHPRGKAAGWRVDGGGGLWDSQRRPVLAAILRYSGCHQAEGTAAVNASAMRQANGKG